MKDVWEILLDSEACDLPISWPEVLSGWTNAGELLEWLKWINDSSNAYWLFYAVDGCSVCECCEAVNVQPEKLEQARATVVRLPAALKCYWISSGRAPRLSNSIASIRQGKRTR